TAPESESRVAFAAPVSARVRRVAVIAAMTAPATHHQERLSVVGRIAILTVPGYPRMPGNAHRCQRARRRVHARPAPCTCPRPVWGSNPWPMQENLPQWDQAVRVRGRKPVAIE